jgi:peroxiredoxin
MYQKAPDTHGLHFDKLPAGSTVDAVHVQGNLRISGSDGAVLLFRTSKAYRVPKTLGIFPSRVTYVIDKAGLIRHVFSAPFSADRHVAEALDVVRQLVRERGDPSVPQS